MEPFNSLYRSVALYLNYTSNFDRVVDTYKQFLETDDSKWIEWNTDCKTKSGSDLSLSQLLLLPLDRLSDFIFFLQVGFVKLA